MADEILAGNVPTSARTLRPVELSRDGHTAVIHVTDDYLAVGSDADFVRMPLSPGTAQWIADRLGCVLPTPRIVDAIARAATIRVSPQPIPPSPAMTTMPVFVDHDDLIRDQLAKPLAGGLIAGHKKDVVISAKAFAKPARVAIYGWHKPDGTPIQPIYAGHVDTWVDYSHGIRLVERRVRVDGEESTVEAILRDPARAGVLSDEGALKRVRYPTGEPTPVREELTLDRGVRVVLDRPAVTRPGRTLLIVYALPNGNTIEQTIGRRPAPGDDWRVDIQHIGAQTAFVRRALEDRDVVVAYLENDLRSWPAWKRRHGETALVPILETIARRFDQPAIALTAHSGGGSLIFGLIDALGRVPDRVDRIAFLDANYGYESARHLGPLTHWLDGAPERRLVVLAYDDANALLNGKPFVSAEGGTWGRSRRMLDDFAGRAPYRATTAGPLTRHRDERGQAVLLRLENPDRKILHTVQVERNGFIESMLIGTAREGVGYRYLGPRAYEGDIEPH